MKHISIHIKLHPHICIYVVHMCTIEGKKLVDLSLQRKLSNETFMPSNFIFKVKNIMFICLCVNITLDFPKFNIKN